MGTAANKTELDPRSSCLLYTGRLLIDDLRELVVLPVFDQGDLLLVQLFRLFPALLAPAPAVLINL
jgi:hypothetical protein